MEMERINDNTIRVMVENDDLKDRGTSVRDLLSDRNKIESFFYNILSELDTDQEFADNDKVSFQVLPNQNGLELFISRLDDEEALGSLLSTLSQREENEVVNEQASDSMSPIDDLSFEQKQALQESDQTKENSTSVSSAGRIDVVELKDFEDLLSLVALLNDFEGDSSAYQYKGKYYLSIDSRFLNLSASELNSFFATLIEYGRFAKQSDSFLSEHGDLLFRGKAIQSLNKIFASA
ncbi:adaptor protein MecA [Fructobacillus sp. CRL 2054]|uniref:adaptor protein MecA n=1 Tax=Fructobacillus sp. CRL 2054 TaxID=2763007 RepID=UPI002377F2A9|nr:adaptor protein MecA [Fructobacillus sp. CRL 2054]MDD9138472.1 adaptor protein MecA [Fructobacillus sp. CRL 2054]